MNNKYIATMCNCIDKSNILHGCFGEDVSILLANGLIKKSQDIIVGDILMGDDDKPRVVEEVTTGIDELFEVNQINGIKYIVNTKHILLLKNIVDDNSEFVFEMSTEQYMSLNNMYKSILSGYKSKLNRNSEALNTPITVKHIGQGTYYGYAIDGNKQFVLSDFTVVHNCNTKYCKTCGYEIK